MSTKYILEQIKIEGAMKELIAKTNAENVEVTVNGETKTLAAVLASMPTTTSMGTAISAAIAASGHATFEKVDAVPAVADAQTNVLYLVKNTDTGHYDIYAKIAGAAIPDTDPVEYSYTMELLDDTTVDMSGKLDKVTGATADHLAALNTDGTLKDSGKAVGGSTLAATPDGNTLATEAAVSDAITNQATATTEAKGLMSASDKTKLDGLCGVRYGTEVPSDMQNGELFVKVVATTE